MILLFAGLTALADSVQFKMEAPDVVATGEQFRLSFTVNGNASDLQLPDLSNFDVLMGPSTSQSMSTQWINGKTTESVSLPRPWRDPSGCLNSVSATRRPATVTCRIIKLSSQSMGWLGYCFLPAQCPCLKIR